MKPVAAPAQVEVARGPRSGAWQEDPGFGVYVHIPFCRHRCHYCDFNTYEGQDEMHAPYVEALIADIERWEGPTREATSVFFGGGTPTLLAASDLGRVLTAVRNRIGIARDAEATVEANPETVDLDYLEQLLEAGFGRISLGVQSLAPNVLERLGRTHSASTALSAVAAARSAGFDDLNLDLIYGSPWESDEDWTRSLGGVIEADPDHVSAYALTVEEGTPLATLVATGRVPDVDPDLQADRYGVAGEMLGAAGYERYEVSNWSKPNRASRHNVLYWSAGDYLGFGAGAHAHLDGERWWSVKLPRDFVDVVTSGRSTRDGSERLERDARVGEALMLGLRLAGGIDLDAFDRRFGAGALTGRNEEIRSLEALGVLEIASDRLRLTARGTYLANEALSRLL